MRHWCPPYVLGIDGVIQLKDALSQLIHNQVLVAVPTPVPPQNTCTGTKVDSPTQLIMDDLQLQKTRIQNAAANDVRLPVTANTHPVLL